METKRIHQNLKKKLANEFVGVHQGANSYITWKLLIPTYAKSRLLPENTVFQDMEVLERENVFSVGNYESLKEIFEEIHVDAVKAIEVASREIQNLSPSTENAADSDSAYAAEILIEISNKNRSFKKT